MNWQTINDFFKSIYNDTVHIPTTLYFGGAILVIGVLFQSKIVVALSFPLIFVSIPKSIELRRQQQ